jgi:uncharacterized protein DUF2867
MLALTQRLRTFPSVRIVSRAGRLPIEVTLIAQLGPGAGDELFAKACTRQRAHSSFIDALDEPSARLGGMDLPRGDTTSLYSFAVGAKGHPFHRHAGHRVFTAVSGSGGAQLRFSSATPEAIEGDPRSFLRALRYVDIPPDSLFTLRFGDGAWHQFAPLSTRSSHPAFFALSCHTNELGGALTEDLRAQVLANTATIPALTELLPAQVTALLESPRFDPTRVARVALSLHAPAGSLASFLCRAMRRGAGQVRRRFARACGSFGFLSGNGGGRGVVELDTPPADSLLRGQLAPRFDFQDIFALTAEPDELSSRSASVYLAALLEGFLENRPLGVTRLMSLRNALVKPLGLRTSPLGCPVSSLLGPRDDRQLFAGRFPVLAQACDSNGRRAQVVLGADDKHLRFRSCVGVEIGDDGRVTFSIGTRVRCTNLFGRFYMAAIDRVHRAYVTPTLLRLAADHAICSLTACDMAEAFEYA